MNLSLEAKKHFEREIELSEGWDNADLIIAEVELESENEIIKEFGLKEIKFV